MMRRLTLQKLIIISRSEKKARIIEFDPKFTLFTSVLENGISLNRTGKSLAMKSIYHSLGAQLSVYPVNWDDLKISTIVYFKIDEQKFMLFREDDYYLLVDEVSGNHDICDVNGLTEFYKANCNYNIALQIHNSDKVYPLPPSGLFLPFFMDQDAGWNSEWKSLNGFGKYVNGIKELLLFHTGIHSNEYFTILEQRLAYINEKLDKNKEIEILTKIFKNQIQKYACMLDIEVDLKAFQKELDIFSEEINKNMESKRKIKTELTNINTNIIQLKNHISNARKVLNDVELDIGYLEKQHEPVITCPICGTDHVNTLDIKYSIYRDREDCQMIISDSLKDLQTLEKKKQKILTLLPKLNNEINSLDELLHLKKENVSLENVMEAIGIKNITENLQDEIKVIKERLIVIEIELNKMKTALSKITKNGKEIQSNFSKKLNSNFINLEVIDEDVLSEKRIPYKIKSTGSDNPRGVLALLFSYYEMIQMNPYATLCPLVIDSPLQQDQGSQKSHLIMDVIYEKQPLNSQIIVATTDHSLEDKNIKTYNFIDEKKMLLASDYDEIHEELSLYRKLIIQGVSESIKA